LPGLTGVPELVDDPWLPGLTGVPGPEVDPEVDVVSWFTGLTGVPKLEEDPWLPGLTGVPLLEVDPEVVVVPWLTGLTGVPVLVVVPWETGLTGVELLRVSPPAPDDEVAELAEPPVSPEADAVVDVDCETGFTGVPGLTGVPWLTGDEDPTAPVTVADEDVVVASLAEGLEVGVIGPMGTM
jgi:hypothetical protein